ncbi:peptide ABC transporter substrate-binding protein [uncultured Ruminococcus sp.]|uniref:peptide ABC transporter substrate-binding protein n=1 Tax=uncultured Ruminococcus sp. TaxID=165186 RepID=UPI00260D2A91|nr:peptide ABC transporter substrate-binding protein [uncultured Ruminococcus sp.]
MRKIPLMLCAVMLAAACGGCGSKDRGDGAGHMYDAPLQGNPKSLDPQFASDPSSNTVIKNMYSGLMKTDDNGNISCCNAEKYTVSDDGLTYTFQLRKDNYWFIDKNGNDNIEKNEYFPVTAGDYVYALQRVLDPKMQSPYAEYYSCIQGGSKIISGQLEASSAGVKAKDSYTLEIKLDYPSSEFLNLLAAAPSYPCNKEFFDSTKGTYGLNDKSVMSNGAFYMRQWMFDPYGHHNILYMRRNDVNTNLDYQVIPSYLSFTIQNNEEDVRDCFKDDEIECFTTFSGSDSAKKNNITSKSATTLGLVFNDKNGYFASAALRKAVALSVNREQLADELSDDIQAAYGIIPPAARLAGRSYREMASDRVFDCYDPEKAKDLVQRAKNELGVGSLENVKIMVCADTVNSSYLHLITQNWQDVLGVYIGIEDVSEEEFYRRLDEHDFSIALYPLRGSLSAAYSVFEKFESDSKLKSASDGVKHLEEILRCTTVSETAEKCTAAERAILEKYGFVPVFYKNSYLVADKDNEDIFFDPFTGAVDYRLAKNYS